MKRFSRSRAYTNIKLGNSVVYIALGVLIAVQILRWGFRLELLAGMILALAFIALGSVRIGAYLKEKNLR